MYIQNEIDQGIEVLDRAPIAHFGPFDPERLSLTVDAFTRGALVVDGLIEGTLAIQQGPHQSALFLIGIFDTTFAPGELGMVTGLARRRSIEQRTAIALHAIAVGVRTLVGGMHAQSCRAARRPIRVARHVLVPMGVERDGGDALPVSHRLIDVPVIERRISCYTRGKLASQESKIREVFFFSACYNDQVTR